MFACFIFCCHDFPTVEFGILFFQSSVIFFLFIAEVLAFRDITVCGVGWSIVAVLAILSTFSLFSIFMWPGIH